MSSVRRHRRTELNAGPLATVAGVLDAISVHGVLILLNLIAPGVAGNLKLEDEVILDIAVNCLGFYALSVFFWGNLASVLSVKRLAAVLGVVSGLALGALTLAMWWFGAEIDLWLLRTLLLAAAGFAVPSTVFLGVGTGGLSMDRDGGVGPGEAERLGLRVNSMLLLLFFAFRLGSVWIATFDYALAYAIQAVLTFAMAAAAWRALPDEPLGGRPAVHWLRAWAVELRGTLMIAVRRRQIALALLVPALVAAATAHATTVLPTVLGLDVDQGLLLALLLAAGVGVSGVAMLMRELWVARSRGRHRPRPAAQRWVAAILAPVVAAVGLGVALLAPVLPLPLAGSLSRLSIGCLGAAMITETGNALTLVWGNAQLANVPHREANRARIALLLLRTGFTWLGGKLALMRYGGGGVSALSWQGLGLCCAAIVCALVYVALAGRRVGRHRRAGRARRLRSTAPVNAPPAAPVTRASCDRRLPPNRRHTARVPIPVPA